MPASWTEVRSRLLTRVFYEHPEPAVAASTDLIADGYLDSMSILVILGILDEELGDGVATLAARIPDTISLAAIEAFYARLQATAPDDTGEPVPAG